MCIPQIIQLISKFWHAVERRKRPLELAVHSRIHHANQGLVDEYFRRLKSLIYKRYIETHHLVKSFRWILVVPHQINLTFAASIYRTNKHHIVSLNSECYLNIDIGKWQNGYIYTTTVTLYPISKQITNHKRIQRKTDGSIHRPLFQVRCISNHSKRDVILRHCPPNDSHANRSGRLFASRRDKPASLKVPVIYVRKRSTPCWSPQFFNRAEIGV